jgi:hypothetical protein
MTAYDAFHVHQPRSVTSSLRRAPNRASFAGLQEKRYAPERALRDFTHV